MQKNEIKKKYFNKIKELNKHNLLYYQKSKPIISDKDYDKLKKEIFELEKKYTFLISDTSHSNTVGY